MAYIDFATDPVAGIAAGAPRHDPVPAPAPATFSALEWSVIALAQRDRLSSLAQPGRVSVALGKVFGGRGHNPRLADPRLEALRRLAVLSWHRGFGVPGNEVSAFLAAGFTPDHYETMLVSISAARSRLNAGR